MVPFHICPKSFGDNHLWFLWCSIILYSIYLVFSPMEIYHHLHDPANKDSLIWTFFEWFSPLMWWSKEFAKIVGHQNLWKMKEEVVKTMSIFISNKLYFFFIRRIIFFGHKTSAMNGAYWHTLPLNK